MKSSNYYKLKNKYIQEEIQNKNLNILSNVGDIMQQNRNFLLMG